MGNLQQYHSHPGSQSSLRNGSGCVGRIASGWLGCTFIALSVYGGGLQTSEADIIIRASEVNGGTDTLFEWGPGSANYESTFDVVTGSAVSVRASGLLVWAAAHPFANSYDSILSINNVSRSEWTSGISGVDFFMPPTTYTEHTGIATGSEFGIQKLGNNAMGQVFYNVSDVTGNILTVENGSILISGSTFSDLAMVDLSGGPVTIFSTAPGNNIVLQLTSFNAAVPEPTTVSLFSDWLVACS